MIARGVPVSLGVLAAAVLLGRHATAWTWAAFCVASTVVSLSHSRRSARLSPAALAGRALSACNLLIFVGVFVLQWASAWRIDALQPLGWGARESFPGALAMLALCCGGSYVWFLGRDDRAPESAR